MNKPLVIALPTAQSIVEPAAACAEHAAAAAA